MRDFIPCKGCDEPEACEIEGRCLEPAPEPLTDEECDKAAAQAMDQIAAAKRLHALDLNPDVTVHHTLRRELVRAGFALAHGVGACEAPSIEGRIRRALEVLADEYDRIPHAQQRHCVQQILGMVRAARSKGQDAPHGVTPSHEPEPAAWYWQHVMQESKGVIESGFSGTRVEPTDDAMWDGKVATVVTELHAGRKLLPPKFAAAVGQPTEIPPAGVRDLDDETREKK